MRQIFEICVNIVDMFIAVSFITLYLGFKYKGKINYIAFLIMWCIGTIELSIINHITFFESVGTYLYIALYFIYSIIFLNGNTLLKLWMSIITQIIATMDAVVVNVVISCILNYDPNKVISEFNIIRVVAILVSKFVLVAAYVIILRNKYKNPIRTALWYKLILVPLVSVVAITTLMKAVLKYPDIKIYALLGMLCIVIANITTYYFYTVLCREYENKLKVKLLEQQYENVKKNMEDADSFIRQMRTVKHDIKNHLLTINGYIETGDLDGAKNYISTLTEVHMPKFQSFIKTENAAFNSIVNSKIALCNEKKIVIEIKAMDGILSKFDSVDIGVLFGNLLDNAIEAAENIVKKNISVNIQEMGEYFSILVSNSIDKSVLVSNETLITTKSNKELHGIGIKTVKSLVKKYDGMISFFEENGEFCCHILIDKNKI